MLPTPSWPRIQPEPCRPRRGLNGVLGLICYRHGAPNGAFARWPDGHAIAKSVRMELFLVHRPEDIAFVVRHLVLLEERQVLLPKGLARMVSHLVPDVVNHPLELRVRI